jgi:hypothetical protein
MVRRSSGAPVLDTLLAWLAMLKIVGNESVSAEVAETAVPEEVRTSANLSATLGVLVEAVPEEANAV